MAPVNPAIQKTNDPSYGNNSRPIDAPDVIKPRGVEENRIMPEGQKIGDRSAEYLGQADAYGAQAEGVAAKGFGDLFADIAKGADFLGKAGVSMIKKDIEDKVYDVANKERQNYTEYLESIKASGKMKGILSGDGGDGEGDGGGPPDEISTDLPQTLERLNGARQAGKISNTDYQGRLLAAAKDLRARHPGFRKEIDDEFAKVTGVNPANAYVNSLLRDINAQSQSANKDLTQGFGIIKSNMGIITDGVDAPTALQKLKNGDWTTADVIKWAMPAKQEEFQIQTRKAKMDDVNLGREEKSRQAGKLYDEASSVIVNRAVDGIMNKLGITDIDSAATATARLTPQQWEQEGQRILNMRAQLRFEMKRAADANGLTKNLVGGTDELNKKIDASLKIFDEFADRVYGKDAGTLFSLQRDLKGQKDQDTASLLRDSKVGPFLRQNQILKDIVGESNMGKMSLGMISGDYPNDYKDYFKRWKMEFMTQSSFGATGKPSTVSDLFDDMKKKDVNVPKASADVMDTLSLIGKDKTASGVPISDAMKINLALSAFSKEERSWVSKLNPDGYDNQGRKIQGQNAVFQKMTSPEITKEMKRLGETNPEVWRNYREWTEDTLGKHLIKQEVDNLASIGENPNIRLGWNSDNKQFEIKYEPQPGKRNSGGSIMTQGESDSYYVRAKNSITTINDNLKNYKNVAEASGQDVEVFMLRSLRSIGADLTSVRGIPARMLEEIDRSRSFEGRYGASKR